MIKRIWKITASVKTTFWLLAPATLFFIIGAVYFRFDKVVLPQLNFQLFQDWIRDYGWKNPGLSWWFFILLALLFLLGVNTFACIADRLIQLLPLWKKSGKFQFAVTISPTVIHLIFLIILAGHLLSSITGSVETMELNTGQTIELPGNRKIRVLDMTYDYFRKPASLKGKLKGASASLIFESPKRTSRFTVKILSPAFHDGYSFHLDSFDKYAREKKMRLILRKDAGIRIIIPGLVVIIALMGWYFPALWRLKKKTGQIGG